jgi:putative membrane protein
MVTLPQAPATEPRGPILSPADRAAITNAVKAAEAGTSAEIVVVIATDPCEEGDATVALVAAGFAAIGFAGPLWLTGLSLHAIVVGQALTFGALAALGSSSRVRRALRIDRLPSVAAHEAAERAFEELDLGRTEARTGVLIHVAVADRHVEVIADEGVHAALAPETWSECVADVVRAAKAGRLAEGVVEAVRRCGAALAEALPPQPGLGDELPDEPVTR